MGDDFIKALILSCNTGQGHNSVSRAIEDAYALNGETCVTQDSLSFISEHASSIICDAHTKLYRYLPKVSDTGYKIAENHPKLFEEGSIINGFLTSGCEKLYDFLVEGGYDCVICPHVFSALMMTQLAEKYPDYKVKTCFVATDYTLSPITSETNLDAYFVPDEKLAGVYSSCIGVPIERVHTIAGIPVRRNFYNIKDKTSAKAEVNVPPESKHIIMMFGSMGCGPMAKLTSELAGIMPEDSFLTVVCGTNELLRKRLGHQYKSSKNIRIEGFVKDMSLLMDSADIYITKPGGLSISEARIKHLPLVLVNAVAGCEQENLEFFVERGAAVTASAEEDIASLCVSLLNDENKLREMSGVFSDSSVSAEEIYEIMKKIS